MVTVETSWEISPYTKEALYIVVSALEFQVSTPSNPVRTFRTFISAALKRVVNH